MKVTTCAAAVIGLLLLLSSPAIGQATSFNPEIELEVSNNDNVLFLPQGQEEADSSLRLQLVLPWLREWNTGSLLLSYSPAYEAYSDFEELDNDSHRFDLTLEATPGKRSAVSYGLRFDKTRQQGSPESVIAPELIAIRRLDRNLLLTDFLFSREAGRRMSWTLGAGVRSYHYSEIENLYPEAPTTGIEDREEYSGAAGLLWAHSRAGKLGIEVGYEIFDLEESGDEKVALASFAWTHGIGRDSQMELRFGGFYRDVNPTEEAPDANESGVQGRFRLTKSMRRSSLSFFMAREPSSGGVIAGTATDTTVQLIFAGDPRAHWYWVLTGRYSRREPTGGDLSDITNSLAMAAVEWRPMRLLGFRMSLDYLDQSADDPELDRSATTARLGAVWYPKGPR